MWRIYYFPAFPSLTWTISLDGELVITGAVEDGMRIGFVSQFETASAIRSKRIAMRSGVRLAVDPLGDPWWSVEGFFRTAILGGILGIGGEGYAVGPESRCPVWCRGMTLQTSPAVQTFEPTTATVTELVP